ncbi:excisionase family DNA binding protein [Ancylobacter sp. 3268]|uniref:GAF domain-containing protein n=1 Tax=Ancylobacter sp. 3268 TaxID=2817752 RepID=UPI0028634657|nr:GAF domain-containing protein [Ancylobacter sp. 3268]MDR6951529.1 excisionase family DNA binding protein [Ancylobacter sp. 3268]
MIDAEKDILTTADTARLLGVSVRTAQLLIEGGTISSWKTPGGHRRVYRADVMALIDNKGATSEELRSSAAIVVIASAQRLPTYRRILNHVPECAAELFDDVMAAMIAIGALKPHTVLVDLDGAEDHHLPLLRSLAGNSQLVHSRIVAVGEACGPPLPSRVTLLREPAEAVATLRGWLSDDEAATLTQESLAFPIALNERQRLVALERTGLLDTPPEEAFDRLTWLAAHSLEAPIALITLLTQTRQWFKSRIGLELPETPRSWAFCNHTILQKKVFSVSDLSGDPRFEDNPAVAGEPGFRFYAGAPILDGNGFVVGSLCVIDRKPRDLSEREAHAIEALAALASDEVRLRAIDRQLRQTLQARERGAGSRS